MTTPSWSNAKLPLKSVRTHYISGMAVLLIKLQVSAPMHGGTRTYPSHRGRPYIYLINSTDYFCLSFLKIELPCVFQDQAYKSHGHFAVRFGLRDTQMKLGKAPKPLNSYVSTTIFRYHVLVVLNNTMYS